VTVLPTTNFRRHDDRVKSLLVGFAAVFVVVGCGDGTSLSDTSVSSGSDDEVVSDAVVPNGQVVDVQVLDNSYRPLDLTIEVGTEVRFDNKGRNEHNILPDVVKSDAELIELLATDDSPTAWGVVSTELSPGDEYSHVFLEPGVYPYYCSIHGVPGKGMYGVIVVE